MGATYARTPAPGGRAIHDAAPTAIAAEPVPRRLYDRLALLCASCHSGGAHMGAHCFSRSSWSPRAERYSMRPTPAATSPPPPTSKGPRREGGSTRAGGSAETPTGGSGAGAVAAAVVGGVG